MSPFSDPWDGPVLRAGLGNAIMTGTYEGVQFSQAFYRNGQSLMNTTEFLVSVTPVVGTMNDIYRLRYGRDMFGRELSA